jgi:hypothetical protein
MILQLIEFIVAVLALEWAMIVNVNIPTLGNAKGAKVLAIIFAVMLIMISFGLMIWI